MSVCGVDESMATARDGVEMNVYEETGACGVTLTDRRNSHRLGTTMAEQNIKRTRRARCPLFISYQTKIMILSRTPYLSIDHLDQCNLCHSVPEHQLTG